MTDPSPPSTFIARILGPGGRAVGVGALVTERHVVTCAHVVNAALGLDARQQRLPDGPVTLDFPLGSLTGSCLGCGGWRRGRRCR